MIVFFKANSKDKLFEEIKLIYQAEEKLEKMLQYKDKKYADCIKRYKQLINIHRKHVSNVLFKNYSFRIFYDGFPNITIHYSWEKR